MLRSPIKTTFSIVTAIVAWLALVGPSDAAIINVPADGGLNITNTNTGITSTLVDDVAFGVLGNNSVATNFDWLAGNSPFSPGIIESYNLSQSAALPTIGSLALADDNASENGSYSLSGSYYATIHWGAGRRGAQGGGISAYYFANLSSSDTLRFVEEGIDQSNNNGRGGISSVRFWNAGVNSSGGPAAVPEPGTITIWSIIGAIGTAMGYRRRLRSA